MNEMPLLSSQAMGRVAVMMGGVSGERDVSLESGKNVLQSLKAQGVDAFAFDPQGSSLGDLIRAKPNRVFMILHGQPGEDGRYQAVLDLHGIPYTGSGMLGSALALDKRLSKEHWQNMHLPTPAFTVIQNHMGSGGEDYEKVRQQLSLMPNQPLVVKPSNEGSSLGITIVRSASDWDVALERARKFRGEVLAEAYISGGEYTVGVIGNTALPIVAIRYATDFYDYEAKYVDDRTQLICPCSLPKILSDRLQKLAVDAAQPLRSRGWYRADFIVSEAQEPYLLEINTAPGMTSHSLVPKAAKVHGWEYGELVMRILSLATFDPIH